MPDLIRFVDSIAASPTVRLDLNDEVTFWVKSFNAAPPRLRRSVAANAMRDGINVGSAAYDGRTLTLEVEIRKSSQDGGAAEIQKLWRELDRPTNYLMYQPQGATKPVFFRTFRSDASQLVDIMAQVAMRDVTIELLAEHAAIGLKETLGPFTVNDDPTAASNPCYVDLPAIIGDIPADIVYWDAGSNSSASERLLAMRWSSTPGAPVTSLQAESATLGADTTNPGGGPDAAMSGTGANNFRRTSFATNANMASRLQWASVVQPGGSYRVIAIVRRSGSSSTFQASVNVVGIQYPAVTIAANASQRIVVDLGVVSWPDADPVGKSSVAGISGTTAGALDVSASRTSGAETLDWDVIHLIPAGGQYDAVGGSMALISGGPIRTRYVVSDGENGRAFCASTSSDPTTTAVAQYPSRVAGAFPQVAPGVTNRLYVLSWDAPLPTCGVTSTTTVNISYWPRYLHVRPVST